MNYYVFELVCHPIHHIQIDKMQLVIKVSFHFSPSNSQILWQNHLYGLICFLDNRIFLYNHLLVLLSSSFHNACCKSFCLSFSFDFNYPFTCTFIKCITIRVIINVWNFIHFSITKSSNMGR